MPGTFLSDFDVGIVDRALFAVGIEATVNEREKAPFLVGVVNGVNFEVRFVTASAKPRYWTEMTLIATFVVDQEVSPVVGTYWNWRNRFARVYRISDQLTLSMDVSVVGGVSNNHLVYMMSIWAQSVKCFVDHLRTDYVVLKRCKASFSQEQVKNPASTMRRDAVERIYALNTFAE